MRAFRSTTRLFDARRSLLSKEQTRQKKIRDIIQEHITAHMGEGILTEDVIQAIAVKDARLRIETKNKIIAAELFASIDKLEERLRGAQIEIRRISIV